MSLQQITLETKGSDGIRKEINKNSIDIVFDILQVYAYSMPIESTVRELTSNAVDSQREKEIAIEILTGKKKIEDYFIVKHGKEFEDSVFNAKYYNLDWLDDTKKEVELEYIEHQGSGFCDEFIVRDYGVGLGNGRMEGILQLGYSSKRGTKELMGSYGLGAKSPLSTMTPFYTMVSCYNGQLYKVNIYSKKIDDLIGPFNLETGEANEFITLSNGAKLYYEKTDRKNCTEIIVPVKKLNKHKYFDAVSSQLLYLPNVRFYTTSENGYRQERTFRANVIYNSDNIIISDNSRFSRPHLVVVKDKSSNTGICYNEIQYKELELEQRYGQVGLKVQIRAVGKDEHGEEYLIHEGIAVTPNREQVIWNDDTKNYLLKITKNVTEEAGDIVTKQLIEDDFLKWIEKCGSVLGNIRSGSTLHELSQMIDKSNIVPTYSLDKSIKYKSPNDMFWGMYPRTVSYRQEWKSNRYVKKVERSVVDSWHNFAGYPVYYKLDDGAVSHVKDQFILQTMTNGTPFVILELLDNDKRLDELLQTTPEDKKVDVEDKFNKKLEKMHKILEYMQKSELFHSYDDIEVPEEFRVNEEKIEEQVKEIEKKESATLEELRKANGEIVYYTLRVDNNWRYDVDIVWDKIEEKVTTIMSWVGTKIYYGFQEDAEMLKCACRLMGKGRDDWYRNDFKIVKIAQKNEKHFKAIGQHISNFFYTLENNVIKMDDEVRKYYTARYVSKNVVENGDLNFMSNYGQIDQRIQKIYDRLCDYAERFEQTLKIRNNSGNDKETQLFEQLKKYGDFQLFVIANPDDPTAIAEKSKELFGTDLLKNAEIFDMSIVSQVELLKEYASPVSKIFNEIAALNDREYRSSELPREATNLIDVLLQHTGLDKFEIPQEFLEKKVAESNEIS